MRYETNAQINEAGNVQLRMPHAIKYATAIDDKSHGLPFTDLGEYQWYEFAVEYAYRHDIMEDTSTNTFVSNKSLTKTEAVRILYNLEGKPVVSEEKPSPMSILLNDGTM